MPPHIILIVSDQHRRDASGCYDSPVRRRDGGSPTPHIDALARRGVVFDHAYCNSPLCAPSRASYHCGLEPHRHTALYHKALEREAGLARHPGLKAGVTTLAEALRHGGYHTAAFGKMHVHGEEATGWDLGFNERDLRFYTQAPGMHYADQDGGDINRRYRQLPPYADRTYHEIDPRRFAAAPPDLRVRDNTLNSHRLETLVRDPEQMFDTLVTNRAIDFIQRQCTSTRPCFLHVGLEKPHEPWSVHQAWLDSFDPAAMPLPPTHRAWRDHGRFPGCQDWQHHDRSDDPAFIRGVMAAYYACVAAMDHQVGRLLAALDSLPSPKLIFYTSDHGELLFDQGLIYKHNFFESSVAVPLIMAGLDLPAGTRSKAPASLVDLMPTCLEAAGLPPPHRDGTSLIAPAKDGATPKWVQRPIFAEFHQTGSGAWPCHPTPRRMVWQAGWRFIYTHGARDQLYHLPDDPHETRDLAYTPAHTERHLDLRRLCLADWHLDLHPRLSLGAQASSAGWQLRWTEAGEGYVYEVWRAENEAPPHRVARGLTTPTWTDRAVPAEMTVTYQVMAYPPLTRPYVDPEGQSRYGEAGVLTATHPDYLPASVPLTLSPSTAGPAQAHPHYHHLITVGGQFWLYEGMPPESLAEDQWHLQGPVALWSHRPVTGDFHWKFTLTPAAAGPTPRCVWDLTSTSHLSHHPLLLRPGRASRIELQRRHGVLTLAVDDSEPTLLATKERPEGRIGLELPLHAAAHTLGPGELLRGAARG